MVRSNAVLIIGLLLSGLHPPPASGQVARASLGAAIGVAGGAVITMSAIVARARFQNEYLESVDDLIHWQTIPMVAAPAAGIFFGLAGQDAHVGSIVGSTTGMVVGSGVGAFLGWLTSPDQEAPWAGGVIGAGVGLTIGGIAGGLLAWSEDSQADIDFPEFLRFELSVPAP